MPVLLVAVALLGLAIGSFLNVVIYRVPRRESLSRPASRCPACGHGIRSRHNIPVLGWLLLHGRCADCAAPISVRYPAVELLTTVLFVGVTLRVAQLHMLSALPAYLVFAATGIALTVIDVDVKRLPNAIVLPTYPILALLFAIAAVVQRDPAALIRAAVGTASLFGLYFALASAYPAGMGFGDVKLAGVVGGVLGYLSYEALLVGAFAAFFLGAVVGSLVILNRRGSRKSSVPFGPFMIAGAILALFASGPIADIYAQVLLPT